MSEANSNTNAEPPRQPDLFPLPQAQESLPPARTGGRVEAARHSPFAAHFPGNRPTSNDQTGVRLSVGTLHSVIQLSTWPTGVQAWESALANALGQPAPQRTGDTQATELGLALRVGPEELLLISDDAMQPPSTDAVNKLREFVRPDIGSVLDLSHARCRIRIEGEHCVDALSKLFALGFREHAFPTGKIQLSSHHHVPCALHRRGSTEFDAYVFTTYVREMLETFADAALEYGPGVNE